MIFLKLYRTLKLLSAIFFLTVIIPGDKLSFPVGLLLVIPFMGITAVSDLLIAVLPMAGIFYVIISCFKPVDTKRGKILTIISLLFFWSFLLFYTNNFIKYMELEPISFTTLLLFVLLSTCCVYVTVRNLLRKSS